jgi:hypothetical protein
LKIISEKMNSQFSLTPGFSPVLVGRENKNRLNGFARDTKPLKRLVVANGHHHPAEAGC